MTALRPDRPPHGGIPEGRDDIVCVCGHAGGSHTHYRRGSDCGFTACGCPAFRPDPRRYVPIRDRRVAPDRALLDPATGLVWAVAELGVWARIRVWWSERGR